MRVLGSQAEMMGRRNTGPAESRVFVYSFLGAFVFEVGLVAALVLWPHSRAHVVRPATIAVRMVTLPAVLTLKPVVKPAVVHKREPKPLLSKSPVHEAIPRPPKTKVAAKPTAVSKSQKAVPALAPSPSPQLIATLMSRYVGLVRPMIQSRLHVPSLLKAMGLTGRAIVEFRLSPQGRLLWAKVVAPSGIEAVNSAALAAVVGGHYPPFLKRMPKKNTTFEITVHISGNG